MASQVVKGRSAHAARSDTMADILERVLDTGVVIAGDIRVQLADIELLTIQIRLVICSVDRAQEMGMDWWKTNDFLASPEAIEHTDAPAALLPEQRQETLDALDERMARLERAMTALLEAQTDG